MYKSHDYIRKTKKKTILLLDTKKNTDYYIDYNNSKDNKNSYNQMNNNKMNKKKKNKKTIQKKFTILRNFSSKFTEGLLCLDSPHKSTLAKRILSEIIPKKLSKKINKFRTNTLESECDLLILNTPKANHSFMSNNFFLSENKTNAHEFIKKRKSQSLNFFNKKTMSYQIIKYPKYDNNKYIKDIIEEDNMDNNNNDEDSFFLLSDKHKIPSLKLNLKKVNMQPEKISINDNKNKSENKKGSKGKINNKCKINKCNNNKCKIKNVSKPFNPQKLYLKKCDMKKHYCHEKFISNFLTPINQFIKNDFHITNSEYENINKKIHNYNYLINNNDFSLYKNRRKKEKYKKFCPPKIPNLHKSVENKYFTIINELKNYKFKI